MRITVSIPDWIGEEAEGAARDEGVSISALYAQAVELYLRERRRDRAIARIGALIGATEITPDALDELKRERAVSERSGG